MSNFTLKVSNYRTLKEINWSPEGVCVLTGPNGAGKSTLLSALKFLRALFFFGPEEALRHVGAGNSFRRVGLDPDEVVEFTLQKEEISWILRFPRSTQPGDNFYGEELCRDGATVLRADLFQDSWSLDGENIARDEQRCCAKVAWDKYQLDRLEWMRPLVSLLEGIRIYDGYWLNQVKDSKSRSADKRSYLHSTGRNIWSVLANWQAAPRIYRDQFSWVIERAKRAFPSLLHSIEFEHGYPCIFMPGSIDPAEALDPDMLADGLLTGLLHLTAVAGAKDGSIIAIDEVENYLHPHAIRVLLNAMEETSESRCISILLTTHSPVVLNHFNDDPDGVYVLGHDDQGAQMPARLSALHNEDWLAQFKLGTSYERLRFGSPGEN